jgi:membrane-bound serine protease (ClpP class)
MADQMRRLLRTLIFGLTAMSLLAAVLLLPTPSASAAPVPGVAPPLRTIAAQSVTGAADAPVGPTIVVAQISGEIDPLASQYLTRVSKEAEAAQADLLLIELNTPGGFGTSMEEMTQTLLASTVPTAVYVTPAGARAGSAGVFIAMAADVVAMAPGTVIGAAHPVSSDGSDLNPTMAAKVTNYAAAYVRSLAAQKGHNADWAEQAVRSSVAITDQEALSKGVVNLIARDQADLLRQLEGRQVTTAAGPRTLPDLSAAAIHRSPPNAVETILKVIANPSLVLLLFLVGVIGIGVEIYHPGLIFPGIVGAISLVLVYLALGELPTNWGAAALLIFSVGLFVLELHLPSHGILGAGAVISFLLGGFLLFAPMTPTAPVFDTPQVSPWLLVPAAILLAAYFMVVLRIGLRARHLPVIEPLSRLTGARGVAVSAVSGMAPGGSVLVRHQTWTAVSDGEPIGAGEQIEVVKREGLKLRVRRRALEPSACVEGIS